jgi:adenylylsulfate kinase
MATVKGSKLFDVLNPWCLLLSGMPNSGKSTIAYHLVQKRVRNALILDGDKHREMQFLGRKLGFSKSDIMENTRHVIKMASFAQEQGMNVIIAQITPFRAQRDLMRFNLKSFKEILCICPPNIRRERPNFKDSDLVFETSDPELVIDTNLHTVEECSDKILEIL